MYKKFIINVNEHETRVALLEDGTVAELFNERHTDSDIAGNIYKGRVQRVLPGMQAAFVDIGLSQAAFIHVDDLAGDQFEEIEKIFIDQNGDEPDEGEEQEGVEIVTNRFRDFTIEELISENQEIMVHVSKAPIGTKGARVTSYISLPGRFLVLMPSSDHIGISRRIEDETERSRLKAIVQKLRGNNFGYIVRTAAEGASEDKFAAEMDFLNNLWENIQCKYKTAPAPSLLHRELTVSLRAVRDLMTHEVEQLIVDSRPIYESILAFLDIYMPNLRDSVELYVDQEPIFDRHNIEGDISRALKKKVWLKSGGYIVIEHTEALVAIDVNTGRYVGKHNLEETILKTNLEAVREIAYQVRLRDIGGIIIIDFIDMKKKTNQEKVYNALEEALKKDHSKTNILPISEMGLVQMTRKRIRKSLNRLMCEPCFYCEGEGYLLSRKSICYNIYREIRRETRDMAGVRVMLHVNPKIAELLHGEENHIVVALEKLIERPVVIYPNSKLHLEEYEIFDNLKR